MSQVVTAAGWLAAPAEVRAEIERRGWARTAAVVVAGPMHRGHEALVRAGLDSHDGVVLFAAADTARACELVVGRYLPAARIVLAAAAAYESPAAAGITTVLPRGPADEPVWSPVAGVVSAGTSPQQADPVDAVVGRMLTGSAPLPLALVRPEVAHLLGRSVEVAPRRGFIVWFTGMSGAGKSTLSQALHRRLEGVVDLEVLDGDEVREHLSRGLSFTREDRDVNVHRIAFVARTLARHGVGVVTAAISPYAATRAEVRALSEQAGIAFIEVYARAELASLVERDVKGLYKKALANEIAHFTGVSDPYEAPTAPDVEAYTDRESVDESLARILAALTARGLVTA